MRTYNQPAAGLRPTESAAQPSANTRSIRQGYSMPRLPDLALEFMSAEQRKVHDAIVSGPRGKVEGPLRIWLRSPDLAERAQALGAFCRYHSSLASRLSELAILVVGAHWRAGFEWAVHAPIAIEAGIDPTLVEVIRTGGNPEFEHDDERAVFAFSRELVQDRKVSDETYRMATDALGERGVVDLTGILGYYTLISMTIVGFQVPLPEGAEEPFN